MKKRKRIMKQVICLIVAIAMLITMTPDCLMNIHQVRGTSKNQSSPGGKNGKCECGEM